jgi:hypothetical protein
MATHSVVSPASTAHKRIRLSLHALSQHKAGIFAAALLLSVISVGWNVSDHDFVPRVSTLDGVAGLMVGAFLVDRLLTFVPPFFARARADDREKDIAALRIGFGVLLASAFVFITNLRAVEALTGAGANGVSPVIDRLFAVLAIAGGVVGLAGLMASLNPQRKTQVEEQGQPDDQVAKDPGQDAELTQRPPGNRARGISLGLLAIAVTIGTVWSLGDHSGIDLLGTEKTSGGTLDFVIRFGLVFVAAGVIQQAVKYIEQVLAACGVKIAKADRTVLLGGIAVVLGVIAARALDLYLMHNIGFFGATQSKSIGGALATSNDLQRAVDACVTGLVIAAGSKPVADLASRLKKVKEKGQAAA